MKKPSRRAFLQGTGSIAIALPFAEFVSDSTHSNRIFAQENKPKGTKFITVYFPNGSMEQYWNFETTLQPIADIRDRTILFHGVRNPVTEKNMRDQHEQGAAALFTGASLKDDQVGTMISLDQFLSSKIDSQTFLKKPLVAGVWRGFAGGIFRSQSWYRRSWLANGEPVTPIVKPLEIFRTIFGDQASSNEEKKALLARKKSVLDSVVKQMKSLNADNSPLPKSHKVLLGTHLDRVRDVEKRVIELETEVMSQCQMPASMPPDFTLGADGLLPYDQFERVYRLQMDLMALAMQCDTTNTGSLMFCCAGEEYQNPVVAPGGHTDHGTSHWATAPEEAVYLAYRKYHAQNLRYLINKLKEAGVHDQTTIIYGSEFGDGRPHEISPQPHLIYSGAETNLKLNQVINLQKNNNACDIYSTLLAGLGHAVPHFGEKEHNKGQIKGMLK